MGRTVAGISDICFNTLDGTVFRLAGTNLRKFALQTRTRTTLELGEQCCTQFVATIAGMPSDLSFTATFECGFARADA
jgi:hypothetical protein